MGNLTIATIFVVTLNVLMFLSQIAMLNINPDGSICYHSDGTVIGETIREQGNLSVAETSALDDLPGSEGTVISGGSSGVFTDIFNNILSWMKSAPGLKYVYGVVSAPYNILNCMNLPSEFVIGMGTLWYLVSLLVLVAFLWGRD